MSSDDKEIARYQAGTAKVKELDVTAAWKAILSDPQERAKAAAALEVSPEELTSAAEPPVILNHGRAGISGGEIIVLIAAWVGTEVVLGALKDLAKEELKRRIKNLWFAVLEPAVRDQLSDRQGLGKRID
jgi:hypothetical protein